MKKLLNSLRRHMTSESGNMSIEFVIAVPLFVAMITGAVDVSRVFITQANFYGAARDTARVVARHAMNEESAEAYAASRIAQITNASAAADVTISSSMVTVSITTPISELAKFNFLDALNLGTLNATVSHAREPI
jgi:Flp pilus assembly protein TadG